MVDGVSKESLALDFEVGSRVGRLFQDVRNAYLKSGGTEEQFVNEVNQGCSSFKIIPIHHNDPTKFESCEVFEFAYGNPDYHRYLIKHGYPLPLGMNDYDDETLPDKWIREEIDLNVKFFQDQLAEDGIKPGTKEYVLSMSRLLADWGVYELSFRGDCGVEATDWQAYSQKCGMCTEKTAIMYYAFRRAGIVTKLINISDYEPTIANYNAFGYRSGRETSRYVYHVCLGVVVPGREKLLYVDVSMHRFDYDYKYGEIITPRQFVLATQQNRLNQMMAHGRYREAAEIAEKCIEIAPSDSTFHEAVFWSYVIRLLRGEEVSQEGIDRIAELVSNSNVNNPTIHFLGVPMGIISGFVRGDIKAIIDVLDNIFPVLEEVRKRHPEKVAMLAGWTAIALQHIISILRTLPDDITQSKCIDVDALIARLNKTSFEAVAYSIIQNPRLMGMYGILEYMVAVHGFYGHGYRLFSRFSEAHPGLSLGYFLRAKSGLLYASRLDSGEDAKPILKDVMQAIAKLEQLDSNSRTAALFLKAQLEAYEKNFERAIELMESINTLYPDAVSFAYYTQYGQIYLAMGDLAKAGEKFRKLLELHPQYGRLILLEYLTSLLVENFDVTISNRSNGAAVVHVSDITELATFLEKMIDLVAENRESAEKVRQLYGILYVCWLFEGDYDEAEKLARKVGTPFSEEVVDTVGKFIGKFTGLWLNTDTVILVKRFGSKSDQKISEITEALSAVAPSILDQPGYLYLQIMWTKVYILVGDLEKAAIFFKRAHELPVAAQAFHEKIATPFFSDCFKDPKSAENRARALRAAEIALLVDGKHGRRLLKAVRGGLEWLLGKCQEMNLDGEAAQASNLILKINERLVAK